MTAKDPEVPCLSLSDCFSGLKWTIPGKSDQDKSSYGIVLFVIIANIFSALFSREQGKPIINIVFVHVDVAMAKFNPDNS